MQLARPAQVPLAFCKRTLALAASARLNRVSLGLSLLKRQYEASGCGQRVCAYGKENLAGASFIAPDGGAAVARHPLKASLRQEPVPKARTGKNGKVIICH